MQSAFDEKRPPPELARATPKDNWEKADVVEQPMAQYMLTVSPSEDLPETIAAFVNRPDVLKARSPRRFAFVEQHLARRRGGRPWARGSGSLPDRHVLDVADALAGEQRADRGLDPTGLTIDERRCSRSCVRR